MGKHKNLAIVRSVTSQGLSVASTARKYRVSRQWVYTLMRRYQASGPAGVEPVSRAPARRPVSTPEPVRKRIIELRQHLTSEGADAGAETIAWHLQREGFHAPSKATIHRILRKAGLVTAAPQKKPTSALIRFEAELPNQMWQADITHWHLVGGTRVDILDFLDDHSRYLLGITAYTGCTGADVVEMMNTLIKGFGPPAATLTDNGLVFTSRLATHPGARNGFEVLLAGQKIQQKNGAPGHPQTQGKIERFHQTLKRWLSSKPTPADLTELQELLDQFRTWYNTNRPHRAIGRRTPEQAYTALPKATPTAEQNTQYRTRRDRVDASGKVTLRYAGRLRHLMIGRANKRQPIIMIIDGINVTTSHAETGEILAEHTLDHTKIYHPKRTPAPNPQTHKKR